MNLADMDRNITIIETQKMLKYELLANSWV